MANRRMLAKSISVSDEVAALSNFAALLFSWMIPHTDDYGIISGSAGRVGALVVPRRNKSEAEVESALEEMRAVGLIVRYVRDGKSYLQLVNFDRHQQGLQKRTAPRYPLYEERNADYVSRKFPELPGNSCLTEPNLTEPNLTEPNLTEGNRTTTTTNLTQRNFQTRSWSCSEEVVDKVSVVVAVPFERAECFAEWGRAASIWERGLGHRKAEPH